MQDLFDPPLPPGIFPRLYLPPEEESMNDPPPATLPFAPPPGIDGGKKLRADDSPLFLILLTDFATDLPLGLFADAEEAAKFAQDVNINPDAHALAYYQRLGIDIDRKHYWIAIQAIVFQRMMPVRCATLFEM